MQRIGIDAGSKTIKLVVLDEDGSLVHYIYRRHHSNIRKTLIEVVGEYLDRYGNVTGAVAITGSAGISVTHMLGLPFVQEVVADTKAVRTYHPDANVIIELGGEDAKVVYLDDPVEQRMNTTCAGGTGGFIDTIASMMGIHTSEMNQYAQRAKHIYPIAHRCAVFAQSDVRPLINDGVSREDLAASVLEAVVKQTIGGLACGRPIQGPVVFLGGPLEHIPELVSRFRAALGLDEQTGIKPYRANVYTVRGAALEAGEMAQRGMDNFISLAQMRQVVMDMDVLDDDLAHLEPLFSDTGERHAFEERHSHERIARASLADARGPLYLGLDMGSTTVKYVLLDEEGNLLLSDYARAEGDALNIASGMVERMYAHLPRNGSTHIAQAVVTGQGGEIVKSGLRMDADVVDITAHARAACAFCPDVDFVLDVGGQDTKGIWVEDGTVVDVILNEPCSSGYGSFIEDTAASLSCTEEEFSTAALDAAAPVALDAQCTVFMTSKVRHAQKAGARTGDISAGLAYSIAGNALHSVIGRAESSDLGATVVVQGGAFKSDAVLRAFEKEAGLEVLRPDAAELMGAVGAALVARDRAHKLRDVDGEEPHSALLDAMALAKIDPVYSAYTCTGCDNACALSLVDFRDGRLFARGNSCRKAADVVKDAAERLPEGEHLGTTSLLPRSQASKRSRTEAELGGGIVIPGYLRSFSGGMVGGGGAVGGEQIEKYLSAAPFKREGFHMKSASRYTRRWGEECSSDERPSETPRRSVVVEVSEKNVRVEGGEIPQVIGLERDMIDEFGNRPAADAGKPTLGIVSVLDGYEQLPFWHTLLTGLGFGVVVTSGKDAADLVVGSAESVPSESVCESAKISHARVYDLRRKGAQALFMPQFERGSRCAVRCQYARALADNVPFIASGEVPLSSPVLASPDARDIAHDHAAVDSVRAALSALCEEPLSNEALDHAMRAALAVQEGFEEKLRVATRRALDWLAADPSRHGILVACRPYHVDEDLMNGIDSVLARLGFAVLAPKGVDGVLGRMPAPDSAGDWPAGERLLRYADFVLDNPQLDLVILQSFGCGYDAVGIGDARRALMEGHRPFTVVKSDEIMDHTHVIARLEAMADSIGSERRAQCTVAPRGARSVARACAGDVSIELFEQGMEPADLDTVRALMPPDLCSTAAAVVAHAVNVLQRDPGICELRLPTVCRGCLTDALPHLLARYTGSAPHIVWEGAWKLSEADAQGGAEISPERDVRVGIVGNPLLCFDPLMNEGVCELLESLGAQPVLPDPHLLDVEDVGYAEQVSAFVCAGVDSILYLQSFGCLKGHIQARGVLRTAIRGSGVPIVVLDYDPDSSRLNRENRIRLMVEAARERARRP